MYFDVIFPMQLSKFIKSVNFERDLKKKNCRKEPTNFSFFFKLLPQFSDFVNSNHCIGKITSKCIQLLLKKTFQVDEKQIFSSEKIRNLGNFIYEYARRGFLIRFSVLVQSLLKLILMFVINFGALRGMSDLIKFWCRISYKKCPIFL